MASIPFPPLARIVRGAGPGLLLAHGAGGSARGNWGPLPADLPVVERLPELRSVVPDFLKELDATAA